MHKVLYPPNVDTLVKNHYAISLNLQIRIHFVMTRAGLIARYNIVSTCERIKMLALTDNIHIVHFTDASLLWQVRGDAVASPDQYPATTRRRRVRLRSLYQVDNAT
jgi:hypothetical protein